MSDRVFFASTLLLAVLLIGFAFVWPQGFGRPSPPPFGQPQVLSQAAKQDLINAANAAKRARDKAAAATAAKAPAVAAPASDSAAAHGLRR
jgi:predicted lipid-binding transport protein (Tim44 family)